MLGFIYQPIMGSTPKTLDGFLIQHKAKDDNRITHTKIGDATLGIYGGSYSIPPESRELFHKLYCKHTFINNKKTYLTETQQEESGPILVDIDERYESKTDFARQHTKDHIVDLIELYMEKLRYMTKWSGEKIQVFAFEKPNPNTTKAEYAKDGIHLVINVRMDHVSQMILREQVIEELCNIFEDLPLTNDYNSLVDIGIARGKTNWQLFGSRKPGNEAYRLSYIFTLSQSDDPDDNAIEFEEAPVGDKMNWLSIIPMVSAQNTDLVDLELRDDIKTIVAQRKAAIKIRKKSSISVANTQLDTLLECISIFPSLSSKSQCEVLIKRIKDLVKAEDDYTIVMAHELTMILDERYYEPFESWMRVGWSLKGTSKLLYPTWLLFSAKSDKFSWDSNDCYRLWREQMNPKGGLTIGSLRYWAKDCDMVSYNAITKETVDHYIMASVRSADPTEYDIARVVHAVFRDQYKCSNIRNKLWYEYRDGRWYEIDSGTTLRQALSQKVAKLYRKKISRHLNQLEVMDENEDADKSKKIRMIIDRLAKIGLKLKKTAWKQNIMRECCECFFDKNFVNMLDTNTELLCFKNGVLDIASKEFRDSRPTDYLSLCTNTDYVEFDPDCTEHLEIRAEIDKFMSQLFPNKNLNRYMWEHLASTLRGDNRNQTFNIYTGCGRNGKSKLVELMGFVLGDYKGTVPLALITQKRASIGGVSPEIAQLKGIRYAVMQEPQKGTKLNEGIMKELTGGDPIQGRALFHDTVTFIPQFTLAVCTNHLFDITSSDDGTWRRIRVCDFVSKFVDEPSEEKEDYEFKVDRNISAKFRRWVPIFTYMLAHRLFETDGIVADCPEVMASSQNYKAEQDYFTGFMKERIVKLAGGRIKKHDVLNEFQEWYAELYGGKVPNGKELYGFLDKHLGPHTRAGWKNWNLYHAYDLIDDDDIQPNGL